MDQYRAVRIIQRNIQSYLKLRNWPWWRLFTKVKPLLQVTNAEDQKREMEEEVKRLNDRFEKVPSPTQRPHPSCMAGCPPSRRTSYCVVLTPSPSQIKFEYHDLGKKNESVLLENQRLEDQLREEKFLTQEAEEMRNLLAQKKVFTPPLLTPSPHSFTPPPPPPPLQSELESLLADADARLDEQDEVNQALQAEKAKLHNAIQNLEEQ